MSDDELRRELAGRLAAVDARIADACRRARRTRDEVLLVAVTKLASDRVAALLPGLGVFDLGESRPQELARKAAALPATVRWHQIGHVQRNKVGLIGPVVHRVHSVDSARLLEALAAEARRLGRMVPVLLEVNASREPAKHGFAPEELPGLAAAVRSAGDALRVDGLMTMAAYGDDPEAARPTFAEVRGLRDRLRREWGWLGPDALPQLSMGMSGDFEVAVEEGATMVRVGSTLFEGLEGGA
jgi:pyridoxal phosphate enzyme (YggS family)